MSIIPFNIRYNNTSSTNFIGYLERWQSDGILEWPNESKGDKRGDKYDE
jgi:hypothetical protein